MKIKGLHELSTLLLAVVLLTAGLSAHAAEPERRDDEWGPIRPGPEAGWQASEEVRLLGEPAYTGVVQPKAGDHERWIDRAQLPQYALDVYTCLEECCDGDGVDDFLMEAKYFTPGSSTTKKLTDTVSWNRDEDSTYFSIKLEDAQPKETVNQQITAACDAFWMDHPEVFWLSGQWCWRMYSDGSEFDIIWSSDKEGFDARRPEYCSGEAVTETWEEQEGLAAEAFSDLVRQGGASWSDQAKAVYYSQWLVKRNEYNTQVTAKTGDPDLAHQGITALRGRTGADGPVCEGYAKAFKILCDRSEPRIPCVLVTSTTHMWNNVQIGGVWYGMDVTWNDPTKPENKRGISWGADSGSESDEWSLAGRTKMDQDPEHIVDNCLYSGDPNRFRFRNGPGFTTAEDYFPEQTEQYVRTKAGHARVYEGITLLPDRHSMKEAWQTPDGRVAARCSCGELLYEYNDLFSFYVEENSVRMDGMSFDSRWRPETIIVAAYRGEQQLGCGMAAGQQVFPGEESGGERDFRLRLDLPHAGQADSFKVFFLDGKRCPISTAVIPVVNGSAPIS